MGRVALYHNLPSGGALRVLEAYLRHRRVGRKVDLFLPSSANDSFARLSELANRTFLFPFGAVDRQIRTHSLVLGVPFHGRRVSRRIDRGGYDVVLACASRFTQAPEILPYLRTPVLYYAPEHNRSLYDHPNPSISRPLLRWARKRARRRWMRWFDRRSIRAATRIMSHSAFSATKLQEIYGVDPVIVRLGVDSTTFRTQGRSLDGSVLSVGGLHPAKGHDFVIESLATLPAEERPLLRIVGDRGGQRRVELEQLAAEREVEVEVHLNVSQSKLVEFYDRAAVLAAAQIQEPFGLVVLEAMACCTPVVAVDEGGLRETIEDGRTGLKSPRDHRQFGQKLREILRNPDLADRLGREGRREVEALWNWKGTADRIDRLLDSLARDHD